ncbi:class I SAM-dependent methyltransferase [Flavobacterium sp. CYK-4]|uniref:class I SAM-dependent methyltransferase n=1 Tax=Flavobacterium lotistagni TaxID=2709660 RepID=UPI00140B53D8|nr:class I SAM-dependent methyltransferase [Flavobacterium lotistagni]NHM07006.1 class I SAM-dependent methyltransferase [Flavobacterium lotistagni]
MKDNFSTASDQYAKFRPGYPEALFAYLKSQLPSCQTAWDCGTGNGQVAVKLSEFIHKVYATDISAAQIEQAERLPNIEYSVQAAEQTNFPDVFFDLIVVAQAIHWFDFEKFYREVNRTAKDNALMLVIGYGLLKITPEIDALILNFYRNIIGPYWDAERRYIDERYQTIPFPFEAIQATDFNNTYHWNFDHLMGYLNTWSAVKHYQKANGHNPVDLVAEKLKTAYGTQARKVNFPLLLRMGKVSK